MLLKNKNMEGNFKKLTEVVFLVMCNPSNERVVSNLDRPVHRSLTAYSKKGHTLLKIQPHYN
jgi:hypothetical protein